MQNMAVVKEVCVLYGSQTGQAESIAENVHETAEEQGIKSSIICLSKAEEAFMIVSKQKIPVVFVCSTTGDGELPGNARKFMRILGRKNHPSDLLTNFRFALLGLGDTNYSTFCGGPKTLERGLKRLGATSFYGSGYADDGTDLEVVVEPWLEGLWPALMSFFGANDGSAAQSSNTKKSIREVNTSSSQNGIIENEESKTQLLEQDHDISLEDDLKKLSFVGADFLRHEDSTLRCLSTPQSGTLPPLMQAYITYHQKAVDLQHRNNEFVPYPLAAEETLKPAKIMSIERLTSVEAVKTAYLLTLDIGNDITYKPGDSFGIIVRNTNYEVDWLIKRLKLDGYCDKTISFSVDQSFKKKLPSYIPSMTTIRYVLENCLEIRSVPKRSFIRALYDFTSSDDDRNILRRLCRKESQDEFLKYVREPNLNLLDILACLPSCQPPFEILVQHLPRIKARLYSAASAHNMVKFVFNVVRVPMGDGRMYARHGIFTGFIDSLYKRDLGRRLSDTVLNIFRTKNPNFRLPEPIDRPIVMIGPGTGVAPFIGFLESISTSECETWLFYGCRNKDKDFLFENQLNDFLKSGSLSHLVVAFSRDSERDATTPKYVQDNLRLRSDRVLDLLLRENAIFYVCGDARNMARDVRECIADILSKTMELDAAKEFLKSMVKDGRYKEDVWT